MLSFSKKAGYGLIAMTYLAHLGNQEVASAREIAERFGIPASLLMNVLKELAVAGCVASVRGSHGGYKLARSPDQIDLANLVTALDGPIRLAECIQHRPDAKDHACKVMDRCPIVDPVHRVQRKLNDFLKAVTLADILQPAQIEAD